MLNLLILLSGFAPLIFGANILVDGASSLAKKYNIPNIVIGLTIVAFGTSAPELIVNIFASASGNSDITLGNIIGSNLFNIMVILGISSLIYPLAVKTKTTWIEIPLCFLSAVIVLVLASDRLIDDAPFSSLTRIDGIVLLSFFLIFMVYNFQIMKSGQFEEEVPVKEYPLLKALLLITAGFVLLIIGGKVIVEFAVKFAQEIGISERVIALTIVSAGTSMPELATSAVAAYKKNVDIAIGNIVGSNIFNAFFILGISAVINPVSQNDNSVMDMLVNIFASLLLFVFIFTGKGRKIERWEGGVFLVLYGAYMLALFL
ncbi:MAG TPA: calcium/sodium antiporter [Spirochaetota bacterium]|nr:calcium/sodium antiporter [Spirochaetota bacterium]HPF07677.1 calcium/sodium antiporter [Spirochaetota bacterium]HRX48902.1 calcium/sodium antiporter [Spirochaetota bacterium]